MFECDIIEIEDFSLNHYMHHFEDCSSRCVEYNEEFECIEVLAECAEEILWN